MTDLHPLRAKRIQEGLTQKKLAERAGIAEQTVVKIENYRATPRRSTLVVLAQALNTVPAALRG